MYLKLSYIGLSLLMSLILIFIGKIAIYKTFEDSVIRKKKLTKVILGIIGWHIYMFALASSGILQDLTFPPRFAIFMIIPAFIFTGIFMHKNKNNKWIENIPERWLIYYQTFRIAIETLFVYTVAEGILHPNVTIEGYNYDMIYAFTAPLIGLLVFNLKAIPKKIALLWNYLGLVVIASIIFLFMTTIYVPHMYGPDTIPFPMGFTLYPYVTVAGFLMPSAVFIHVLSIVQLSKSSKA